MRFYKLTLYFILPLLFACCQEDFSEQTMPLVSIKEVSTNRFTHQLSNSKIIELAKKTIKSVESSELKVASDKILSFPSKTRANNVNVEFHVINFKDDSGFALIASDDRTMPVYAYSDKGHLEIDDELMETGFGVFLSQAVCKYEDDVINRAISIDSSRIPPIPWMGFDSTNVTNYSFDYFFDDYYFYRQDISSTVVSPLLLTNWNYGPLYNTKFPAPSEPTDTSLGDILNGRCSLNSDEMALAQLMAYHNHPSVINQNIVDWNSIASISGIEECNSLISNLLTDYIYGVSCDYGNNFTEYLASPLSPATFRNKLSQFGYNSVLCSSFSNNYIYNSLLDNKPVIGMGRITRNGVVDDYYAKWLIDGIKSNYITTYCYSMKPPHELVHVITGSTPDMYHCNWGGYNGNGYYTDVFNYPFNSHMNDLKLLYNITPVR